MMCSVKKNRSEYYNTKDPIRIQYERNDWVYVNTLICVAFVYLGMAYCLSPVSGPFAVEDPMLWPLHDGFDRYFWIVFSPILLITLFLVRLVYSAINLMFGNWLPATFFIVIMWVWAGSML